MTKKRPRWVAVVSVRTTRPATAAVLLRAMGPEVSREVPRAHVGFTQPSRTVVEIRIVADDTGAMRAALNTYLGWVRLAASAAAVGEESLAIPVAVRGPPGEALISRAGSADRGPTRQTPE